MYKIAFFFLGIIYYFLIQISIVSTNESGIRYFTVHSYIPQEVKLHIQAKRNELKQITCNSQKFSFPQRERLWFERKSEELVITLTQGKNICKVQTQKNIKSFHINVKRKWNYVEFMVLFVLLGLPMISLLFKGFTWLLDRLKSKQYFQSSIVYSAQKIPLYIWVIIFFGMLIRVLYFNKFGITHFQHDWQGHVEFIKYIANYWILPLGEKGLQFPQQPFYYVIMAGIYSVGVKLGLGEMQALHTLGYFALFCSFVFLFYGYKFFMLITESRWVQIVALSFIALTPSLVYMSARINNDVLVMALSVYTLYQSVRSYQTQFQDNFYRALIGVSLLFITKISAAPVEIFLFVLLVLVYIEQEDNKEIKYKLFIFSIVGTLVLGITLLKTYLPIEQTFHMVNSSGGFPGQIIKSLDWSYFSTFNIDTLINRGYAYVFGEDSIRYSFLTYQYGTMFFGEFEYDSLIKQHKWLKEVMQIILTFGLIYIIGFLVFIIKLYKAPKLHKFLFLTFGLNFILILKFMLSYSVVCNTDFRYFITSFGLLAFIFSQGLSYISDYQKWLKYFINIMVGVLSIAELLYFILILF